MNENDIICRVYTNSTNGQKLVTIPKDSDINDGDFVKVIKVAYYEVHD